MLRATIHALLFLALLSPAACGARTELNAPRRDAEANETDLTCAFTQRSAPSFPAPATQLVVGGAPYQSACAKTPDGRVRCWGSNMAHAVSTALDAWQFTAVERTDLGPVRSVAVGSRSACAILADGTARCWGSNTGGALGNPDPSGPPGTAVPVVGLTQLRELACTEHCCAVREDDTVWCWGSGLGGALGDGRTDVRSEPRLVEGLPPVETLQVGLHRTCVITRDHALYCWGSGLPRTGTTDPVYTRPQHFPSLGPVVKLAMTWSSSCVLRADGVPLCWGQATYGQLGLGTAHQEVCGQPDVQCIMTPVCVPGLPPVADISMDGVRGCALLEDGSVRCWGAEFLPDGRSRDRVPQQRIPLPQPVVALLHQSIFHTCAIAADETVYCWGGTTYGDGLDHEPQAVVEVRWP